MIISAAMKARAILVPDRAEIICLLLSAVPRHFSARTLLARVVRMLLSPFWAGTTHVVQLGPIWIGQRGRDAAPPAHSHADEAAKRRGREQRSGNMRV